MEPPVLWGRVVKCDIFHFCSGVMCCHVSTALAYTFAGPLGLKQNGVFTYQTTSGYTGQYTAHSLHIGSGAGYSHFVNSRFAARANCMAAEDTCLFRAVAGREEIYLHPSEQTSFRLLVAPCHPLQFPQYNTREMLPKIMLKREKAHTSSTTETRQVSMNGIPHSIIHRWENL